jgi:hypothetical protein
LNAANLHGRPADPALHMVIRFLRPAQITGFWKIGRLKPRLVENPQANRRGAVFAATPAKRTASA